MIRFDNFSNLKIVFVIIDIKIFIVKIEKSCFKKLFISANFLNLILIYQFYNLYIYVFKIINKIFE